MSCRTWSSRAALAAALFALPGCFGHAAPATGTVAGFRQPVMLGPVDRIGMTEPLPVTTLDDEYEATSAASYTQSTTTSGNVQYTVTQEVKDETEPYTNAVTATAGKGPQTDIRLTMLKARSWGYPAGFVNRVVLEGEVVQVGGAK